MGLPPPEASCPTATATAQLAYCHLLLHAHCNSSLISVTAGHLQLIGSILAITDAAPSPPIPALTTTGSSTPAPTHGAIARAHGHGCAHAAHRHPLPRMNALLTLLALRMQLIDILDDPELLADTDNLRDEVRAIAFWFCGLAAVSLVMSFLSVAMLQWSGARQVARLRRRFLAAALRQEQAFYDTCATTGDVIAGLNEDATAVQQAISEKIGVTVQHVAGFFVAIGIALFRGWELTLVMLALLPLIAVAGAVIAKLVMNGAARMAAGYARGNALASQAIANIRTVASFQAEPIMLSAYSMELHGPKRVQQRISMLGGTAAGTVNAVIFARCSPPPPSALCAGHTGALCTALASLALCMSSAVVPCPEVALLLVTPARAPTAGASCLSWRSRSDSATTLQQLPHVRVIGSHPSVTTGMTMQLRSRVPLRQQARARRRLHRRPRPLCHLCHDPRRHFPRPGGPLAASVCRRQGRRRAAAQGDPPRAADQH